VSQERDGDESLPPTQILSLNSQPLTDDDSVDQTLVRQNAFRFMGRHPTAPAAAIARREEINGRDLLRKSR
jgi:hypothetical protein